MLDVRVGRAATALCRVDIYGRGVSFRRLMISVMGEVDPRLKPRVRLR